MCRKISCGKDNQLGASKFLAADDQVASPTKSKSMKKGQ
jgi:hypothetical protein